MQLYKEIRISRRLGFMLALLALTGSALAAFQAPSVARADQIQFGDAAFVTLW